MSEPRQPRQGWNMESANDALIVIDMQRAFHGTTIDSYLVANGIGAIVLTKCEVMASEEWLARVAK